MFLGEFWFLRCFTKRIILREFKFEVFLGIVRGSIEVGGTMCLVEFNCVFCEGLRVGGIVERSVTSVYKISWPSTKPPTRIGTKAPRT
jgi:hypothetical protein